MPDDAQTHLTRLELRIMQVLWSLGESNVSAVQQALDPPLAYTTVQTMLNILERKGNLERRREGRAFLYRPIVSQARASGQGLRDLIDRMFAGSSEELVMSLLKNRQIDAARLAEISRRFNSKTESDSSPEASSDGNEVQS